MPKTGAIELVIDFVNSADRASAPHTIALREAMRGVIGANSGGRVFPLDIATLNAAAVANRLRVRFTADGKAKLDAEALGPEGEMGRLVAALFAAMSDPEWKRVKVCARPTCRKVFYDRSRNHSSRWCSMASCGNREKAKRFRASRVPAPAVRR